MAINTAEEDKRDVKVDRIWSCGTSVDLVDSKTQLMNYYFYFLILVILPDSCLAKVVFEELLITYQIDTITVLALTSKK